MRCCTNRPNTWMHPTGAHRRTKALAPQGSSTQGSPKDAGTKHLISERMPALSSRSIKIGRARTGGRPRRELAAIEALVE